jgi:hypothetical protein
MKRLSETTAGPPIVTVTVLGCAGMGSGWIALIGGEKGMN